MHVVAALRPHLVREMDDEVDAVLRAHDAEVAAEIPPAAAQGVVRVAAYEPVGDRAVAHDRDVVGGEVPTVACDLAVQGVRDDDMVRGRVRRAFEELQPACQGRVGVLEAGFVDLGTQVVLVEHEAHAERTEEQGERPEGVGRVARLDDVEAVPHVDLRRQPEGDDPAVGELPEEADDAVGGGRGPVAVDADAVEDLEPRVFGAARTDDRHAVARVAERLGLQPHASIERHRQVLHDDQNPRIAASAIVATEHQAAVSGVGGSSK